MAATMFTDISFGDRFFKTANALSPNETQKVYEAVDRFRTDPSHPSLNFEKLNAGDGRLWSIRATQKIRLIVWREGAACVLLEAGQHDIYDRLARGSFRFVPSTGFIGIVDTSALDRGEPELAVHRLTEAIVDDESGVFDHWADADLTEAGFAAEAVIALRSAKSEEALLDLDLDAALIYRAIEIMELTPEQWRTPALIADQNVAESRLRAAIDSFGAAHGLSPFFSPEEVAKIAAAPIEDWMIFLHPDQRGVVARHYEGPARVRGAAGTGKTVVALHRAAELAQRFAEAGGEPQKILFTTFIKTLPPVFEALYRRLPNAIPDAVEFVHVDKLARRVLTEEGVRAHVNVKAIDAAFARAASSVVTSGTPLARAGVTRDYLRDEITKVIKGRAITSLDHYLGIERTGRTVPFNEALRRQTWELMEAWYEEMRRRDTVDFADVLLLARDAARRREQPAYRAAIVDEAQDITLVGLQMIRALVRGGAPDDPPDGLLLVGDGAQRIYPGCYTLRQAGIEVVGRSTVLRRNYRNTAEILSAAMAVAGDQPIEDLDEQYRRCDEVAVSDRVSGLRPILVECAGRDDEDAFVLRRIRELLDAGSITPSDIGVFAPTNRETAHLMGVLRSAGIVATDLGSWDGRSTMAVKVGTYFRAKGLEFKVVFLPGLDERFPRPATPGQDPDEHAEQRSLAISQLFVAMTRARDALFVSTPGSPSEVLVEHLDAFEVVDS